MKVQQGLAEKTSAVQFSRPMIKGGWFYSEFRYRYHQMLKGDVMSPRATILPEPVRKSSVLPHLGTQYASPNELPFYPRPTIHVPAQ